MEMVRKPYINIGEDCIYYLLFYVYKVSETFVRQDFEIASQTVADW